MSNPSRILVKESMSNEYLENIHDKLAGKLFGVEAKYYSKRKMSPSGQLGSTPSLSSVDSVKANKLTKTMGKIRGHIIKNNGLGKVIKRGLKKVLLR